MTISAQLAERDREWSQLMAAAQDGDGAAYARLLRAVTPYLRSLARRSCRVGADVEDAVQDTLLTLHRVRHTYDPVRPFTPWLAAIAARRVIDGLRRRERVGRYESADPLALETFEDPAANTPAEAVDLAELEPLLRQLPARQREALVSTKLQGLSLVEASAQSGQSVAALKVNVHRGIKALQRLFRERTE